MTRFSLPLIVEESYQNRGSHRVDRPRLLRGHSIINANEVIDQVLRRLQLWHDTPTLYYSLTMSALRNKLLQAVYY